VIEKQTVFELAESLIAASSADDTEVFFHESDRRLTRFANNAIHQNVSVTNAEVLIRVAFGRKIGIANSNSLADARRVLEEACEIAKVSADSPDYAGMPEPAAFREIECFDPTVADCSALERAQRAERVVNAARRVGAVAAGAFSTALGQTAILNSNGVAVHRTGTEVTLNVTMTKDGGSGSAHRLGWKLSDVDDVTAANHVAERAVRTDRPQAVKPGDYTVVLEPEAVGVLLRFLAHMGLNGKAYHEKRSFMSGKLGLRVTGPLITIVDDAADLAGIPMPFDFEGVPRERVVFIEKGIAKGMCFDTATASLQNTRSTGHALPAGSSFGPVPLNLFMAPGESSVDEMIRATKNGLLVCNFHYANVAERMKTVLTGMTRFGLFLIRDGEIAHPVKNLRFTQSILEAFDSASALTKDRQRVSGLGGAYVVPGMRCEDFRFTGKTEF
jgi:predicted Zn-dependent protease